MLGNIIPFHQCSGTCQGEEVQRQLAVTVVFKQRERSHNGAKCKDVEINATVC